MSDSQKDGMPCGRCDIGIYCEHAMLNEHALAFRELTPEQRVAQMPRCKEYDRPCQGAVGFHELLPQVLEDLFSVKNQGRVSEIIDFLNEEPMDQEAIKAMKRCFEAIEKRDGPNVFRS